ncbi:hypothetical protein XBJ2_500016 [Xenorhabdus bovienii str. Jollieti]|uniref:Uncharacterized protein n=1 Tax=Xenorhabdus bovienii (strain SS-2004) TaxID=406818 RepID=D3V015_XENBS|nr:hypothetical protein [Xenorhabdus bovienii]CBJ80308.1 hypothetical protein XBJ1_1174 [Xenorhabdus bovienii SS-2004]CDH30041.1 hypothetical protein XBJ2_500016 [Xenorhabdus bovienii str. Jollieti]
MRYERNPYGAQDEQWEQEEEAAAYKEALETDLDKLANDRLGNLPDNTLSDRVNSLLERTGDKRSELMDKYHEWLFDVCRTVEEQRI